MKPLFLYAALLFPIFALGQKTSVFCITDNENGTALENVVATATAEGSGIRIEKAQGACIRVSNLKKGEYIIFQKQDYEMYAYYHDSRRSPDTVEIRMEASEKMLEARWAEQEKAWAASDAAYPEVHFPDGTNNIDSALTVVDSIASFPGGKQALMQYLVNNLRYPEKAIEEDVQGKVYIQFVVETDGVITNVKVVRGVEKSLEREAIRVVRAMPAWTPAYHKGRVVRSYYSLPVNFKLT